MHVTPTVRHRCITQQRAELSAIAFLLEHAADALAQDSEGGRPVDVTGDLEAAIRG
jgi:hypothetical protein